MSEYLALPIWPVGSTTFMRKRYLSGPHFPVTLFATYEAAVVEAYRIGQTYDGEVAVCEIVSVYSEKEGRDGR